MYAHVEQKNRTVTRDQAALYAHAVGAASGISVSEVVFVYTPWGIERSVEVDPALRAYGEELMPRYRTFGLSERPASGRTHPTRP